MALKIERIWIPSAQEWDDAWHQCPYSTYFHGREWAEIWAAAYPNRYDPAPLALELDDGTRIVLPFSRERFFRGLGRRHVSSPAGTFGGWLASVPLDAAHQAAVFDVISARYPDLLWRTNPYEQPVVQPAGAQITTDETHVLDLRDGFDPIYRRWQRGGSSAARKSRKARQAGVSISVAEGDEDWRCYFRVYEDSLRRWDSQATSRYPWSLFWTMAHRGSPNLRLWLAWFEDAVIAGALCCHSPVHAAYWHGAALASHFDLRPVNLLMEEIIRDSAQRRLAWFDFNPSGGHEGVREFKRSFGAKPMPCNVIEIKSAKTRALSAAARVRQLFLR